MAYFYLFLCSKNLNYQAVIRNNLFIISYTLFILHLFMIFLFFDIYLTGYYWLELFLVYFFWLGCFYPEILKEGLVKYFNRLSIFIGFFFLFVIPLALIVYYNNPNLFSNLLGVILFARSLIFLGFSLIIVYKVLHIPLNKEYKKECAKIGMSICLILLTFFITGFIKDIFSSILMMNSLGGNGSGNNPVGGNGFGGNGAGGGNGPGNNPNALPSMVVQPRDDFMSAETALRKMKERHDWIHATRRVDDINIFALCRDNPVNDLTLREKESVVSAINAYRYEGADPDPEKAMIKGTRGPNEDFSYTSNGRNAPAGSLLMLNSNNNYTEVDHRTPRLYAKVIEAIRFKAHNTDIRPSSPIIDSTG